MSREQLDHYPLFAGDNAWIKIARQQQKGVNSDRLEIVRAAKIPWLLIQSYHPPKMVHEKRATVLMLSALGNDEEKGFGANGCGRIGRLHLNDETDGYPTTNPESIIW